MLELEYDSVYKGIVKAYGTLYISVLISTIKLNITQKEQHLNRKIKNRE